eukprot:6321518-Pyramimonas_sp.AAC.1
MDLIRFIDVVTRAQGHGFDTRHCVIQVRSDEIAKEKGMPLFESELLLPRTKGLALLVQCIRSYVT